jgi:hypothetical protein
MRMSFWMRGPGAVVARGKSVALTSRPCFLKRAWARSEALITGGGVVGTLGGLYALDWVGRLAEGLQKNIRQQSSCIRPNIQTATYLEAPAAEELATAGEVAVGSAKAGIGSVGDVADPDDFTDFPEV